MSYTESFRRLHRLSYGISDLNISVQYKRVAVYIGRVLMAETVKEEPVEELDSPISPRMKWAHELAGHRELMLDLVVRINDHEGELIRKQMYFYANRSKGSMVWLNRRHGWIADLDSLRAFTD